MRITRITNKNNENGLTMIELIVAAGIFGLVVSMIFGIFILSLQSQRRIIALRNVEDSVRFTIDAMAREIRTGTNFNGGGNSISFTNAKGEAIIYRLNSNIIEKSFDGGVNYSPITGTESIVDYLNFYLMGQAASDGLQPRITITIGVTSSVGNQTANLKVQTTISGRMLQS